MHREFTRYETINRVLSLMLSEIQATHLYMRWFKAAKEMLLGYILHQLHISYVLC